MVFLFIAAVGAGFGGLPPSQNALVETRPALNPTVASALANDHRWSVWRIMDLRGDRRRHDKRTVVSTIYRQRVGSEHAELIYETYSQQSAHVHGVFADGSVVIRDEQQHILIDRHGNKHPLDLAVPGQGNRQAMLNAAFDEGLFLQTQPAPGQRNPGVQASPLFFIPIRNGLPAPELAVEVSKGNGVAMRARRGMVRHGSEVAWHDEQGLHVFDLHSHEVRDIEIKRGVAEQGYDEVRGFDGRYVMLRRSAVDLNTGESVVKLNDTRPVTLRDGVLYEVQISNQNRPNDSKLSLIARVLDDNPKQARTVLEMRAYLVYINYNNARMPHPGSVEPLFHPLDEGFLYFDGEAWQTQPYYERSPDE